MRLGCLASVPAGTGGLELSGNSCSPGCCAGGKTSGFLTPVGHHGSPELSGNLSPSFFRVARFSVQAGADIY